VSCNADHVWTSKLPHASERIFAKQILVRLWARRTEASANHAICGNFHGPGIECSGCPAERAISPVMYDLTLHIDRLIVCSLLRNAKNDRNFVLLGASTMQKEVAKELPAVISGCNIVPRPLHEYCVLCTEVCCDTSRAPDMGVQRKCHGLPTAQSRGELGC
jgi:hypothetical protein